MNVNDIKRLVEYFASKDQSGGNASPVIFSDLLLVQAQIEFIRLRLGLPQSYESWRNPYSKISYESTLKISEDLAPLKKTVSLVIDSVGLTNRPTDIFYPVALRHSYTKTILDSCGEETTENCETTVEVVDEDEYGTRLCAAIKKPTKTFPIVKFDATTFQFAPKDLATATFTYIKIPVKPKWAFTLDANDNEIYDAINSVQLSIPENNHLEICRIILGYVGVSIKDNEIIQIAEMGKTKGI